MHLELVYLENSWEQNRENKGVYQTAEQQLVHHGASSGGRSATTVRHYVFKVILQSFCALFKTRTTSSQASWVLSAQAD